VTVTGNSRQDFSAQLKHELSRKILLAISGNGHGHNPEKSHAFTNRKHKNTLIMQI